MQTLRSELPLFGAGQANPELTFREIVLTLCAIRINPRLESEGTVTAQPTVTTADDEKVWYVPVGATGSEWEDNEGRLAYVIDGAFRYIDVPDGVYYVIDDDKFRVVEDGVWSDAAV